MGPLNHHQLFFLLTPLFSLFFQNKHISLFIRTHTIYLPLQERACYVHMCMRLSILHILSAAIHPPNQAQGDVKKRKKKIRLSVGSMMILFAIGSNLNLGRMYIDGIEL